jgi:hypothetical protein
MDFGRSALRGDGFREIEEKNAIFQQNFSAACGGQKGGFFGPTSGLTQNRRKIYSNSGKIWGNRKKKIQIRSIFLKNFHETGFVD